VARDRKRAKQRRERQERQGRPGTAQVRRADGSAAPARSFEPEENPLHEHEAPELASGENDLVDAQLALGRPELIDTSEQAAETPDALERSDELPQLADEDRFEALEDAVDIAEADAEGRGEEERAITRRHARERAARPAQRREGNRVANFLRGSWRELERVQWPDRRQVAQATAVVIGFLIVAGAFLGLMDLLASKIVDFII
jgi:preprotein translocase SecE subunit